ncbi:enoyl-CoA hydratase/isomerase family protein [Pseudomonas citronellolis]|uniref:enoyl-CoA hydratase/isomerase family protein n=1 Tax=Pseudomonas citronellolis TaxID=53408 RepID=UPI0021C19B6F|nr:enoyl-CoA hydratase/isomerase family protein [Pseudomonas citronellolis]UXJ50238.1 enoyl-CoA hydratase/isomerase family protein [Pseudomonas citronellolis]
MDSKDQIRPTGAVSVERRDDIAIVTISNPGKLNAMSAAIRDGLTEAFRNLNDDPSCRAIILTGAGENFSAGAELGGWNESEVRQCRVRLKRGASPLIREMIAGAKPIIAAVEGYAFGAGLALAAASDYVVASRTAKFCCAFTKVGFIPDMGLLFSLPNRVGPAKAKQLIALADTIDAERAERLGLADEVVAAGTALAEAETVARRFADGPPLAFDIMKSVFSRGLEAMIQAEVDLQPILWLSDDHVEGKAAAREKRKPRFTGK